MSRLITPFVLLAALGLLATACGPAPDCKNLCNTLIADCAMGTWTDSTACADGCTDELFRHPARPEVMECFETAADGCDLDTLIECKLLAYQTGNVAEGE